ncbi:hypothetical protein LTR53_019779, partial [Teratosphaeriaceae sp. CCFEE 6253]
MQRYVENHPLATWIIPKEDADTAYVRLLERIRLRSLNVRIYEPQIQAEMQQQQQRNAPPSYMRGPGQQNMYPAVMSNPMHFNGPPNTPHLPMSL